MFNFKDNNLEIIPCQAVSAYIDICSMTNKLMNIYAASAKQ
jgi:hypothetical protein